MKTPVDDVLVSAMQAEVRKLRAERDALRAERDALRAKADRYDALKLQIDSTEFMLCRYTTDHDGSLRGEEITSEDLDDAIDAARKEQK